MHINELKFWLKSKVNYNDDFFFIKENIMYMEAILNLFDKKYILLLNKIFQISSIKKKIKLIFFLLIPNIFFKKLKNNF